MGFNVSAYKFSVTINTRICGTIDRVIAFSPAVKPEKCMKFIMPPKFYFGVLSCKEIVEVYHCEPLIEVITIEIKRLSAIYHGP